MSIFWMRVLQLIGHTPVLSYPKPGKPLALPAPIPQKEEIYEIVANLNVKELKLESRLEKEGVSTDG